MKTSSYHFNSLLFIFIALASVSTLILNCGGGGGGSGGGDIANSLLSAEPLTLEVGGTQTVTVDLSDVTQDLAIKFRYPVALQYVSGSAVFENGDDKVATNPAYNLSDTPDSPSSDSGSSSSAAATATPTATPTATTSGSSSSKTEVSYAKQYLVFFITRDAFGSEPNGKLTFRLRAKDVQEGGRLELDVDLDDPSISNSNEFSVADPLFEKEQALDIRIRN